jgi:hypothetical protein
LNYVKLEANEQFRTVSPNEFAIDGSYSLKLSETFSMAVAGRYIRSNLKVITDTEMHLQLIHLRLMLLDSTSQKN